MLQWTSGALLSTATKRRAISAEESTREDGDHAPRCLPENISTPGVPELRML